jgi:ABC-type multidrug transport system fused ATPase/permease subunit
MPSYCDYSYGVSYYLNAPVQLANSTNSTANPAAADFQWLRNDNLNLCMSYSLFQTFPLIITFSLLVFYSVFYCYQQRKSRNYAELSINQGSNTIITSDYNEEYTDNDVENTDLSVSNKDSLTDNLLSAAAPSTAVPLVTIQPATGWTLLILCTSITILPIISLGMQINQTNSFSNIPVFLSLNLILRFIFNFIITSVLFLFTYKYLSSQAEKNILVNTWPFLASIMLNFIFESILLALLLAYHLSNSIPLSVNPRLEIVMASVHLVLAVRCYILLNKQFHLNWFDNVMFSYVQSLILTGKNKGILQLSDLFTLKSNQFIDIHRVSGRFQVLFDAKYAEIQLENAAKEENHKEKTKNNSNNYYNVGKSYNKYSKHYQQLLEAENRIELSEINIVSLLFRQYGLRYCALGCLKLSTDMLIFAGPILLSKLVDFISNYDGESPAKGYLYSLAIILSAVCTTILSTQYNYAINLLTINIRTALIGQIYGKSLKINVNQARISYSSGNITNLMSVDTDRVLNCATSALEFLSLPLQITIALILLHNQVGLALLAGLSLIVFLIPVNSMLTSAINANSAKMLRYKDRRISLIGELLANIVNIKFLALELQFAQKINKIRAKEWEKLKIRKYLDAGCVIFWAITGPLTSISTFFTFSFILHGKLTATIVFTCLALFNILIRPLNATPWIINALIEGRISVKRVNKYLNCPEKQQLKLNNSGNGVAITVQGSFHYGKPAEQSQQPKSPNDGGRINNQSQNESNKNSNSYNIAGNGSNQPVYADLEVKTANSVEEFHRFVPRHRSNARPKSILKRRTIPAENSAQDNTARDSQNKNDTNNSSGPNNANINEVAKRGNLPEESAEIPSGAKQLTFLLEESHVLKKAQHDSAINWDAVVSNYDYSTPIKSPKSPDSADSGDYFTSLDINTALSASSPSSRHRSDSSYNPEMSPPVLVKTALFVLSDLNFSVAQGEFIGVSGPVASGKSSLLLTILGELDGFYHSSAIVTLHSTRIAYLPQQSFLLNATIRENILFGAVYQPTFYNFVVTSCALGQDFAQFPAGDLSEVGESGINLSGGQKARINLARALYSNAEIYLIDDIFASIDVSVAKHIYKSAIQGFLLRNNKTVVLVSHQTQFLGQCNRTFAMNKGKIEQIHTVQPFKPGKSRASDQLSLILGDSEAKNSITLDNSASMQPIIAPNNELASSRITIEESRAQGTIERSVYWAYLSFIGPFLSILTLISLISMQATRNGSDLYLSYWAENVTRDNSNWELTILAVLALCNCVFAVFRAFIFAYSGLVACRNMFSSLLLSVIHSKIQFFEQNPIGRILNRFSTDLYSVDENLPFQSNIFLAQFFLLLGSIVVICCTSPLFLVLLLPLSWLYYRLQANYRVNSREIRRLDSVTRSPIYSLFSQTLSGLIIIRNSAHKAKFSALNLLYLENNQDVAYTAILASQWLTIRLQIIGIAVIAFISLFSVILLTNSHSSLVNASLVGLGLAYAYPLTDSLNALISSATETEKEVVSVERIIEYCGNHNENLANQAASIASASNLNSSLSNNNREELDTVIIRKHVEFLTFGRSAVDWGGFEGRIELLNCSLGRNS